jgi:hypothetical protein
MGASESTAIHVNFDRTSLIYYHGEQVAGTVNFDSTHDKLTLDELFLEFVAEMGYTTRETRLRREANGRQRTEQYTAYHHVPFWTYRVPVVRPPYGQVSTRWFN